MVSWHNLKDAYALRDRLDAEVAAVQTDKDLTTEAKARRVRELVEDFEPRYLAEKRELVEAMEQHRHTLTKKAYPAERLGDDVQRALLEEMVGQRIEREIAAQAEGGGFDPVSAVEDARYRGDEARQAVLERVGKRYLPEDRAYHERFSALVEEGRRERMTPPQRSALEQLEAFEHQSAEVGQALAFMDTTTRAKLQSLSRMSTRPDETRGVNNLNQTSGGYRQAG